MREGGTCGSGLEGLEVVALVCCCLVVSLDRLSGFLLFAIHSTPWVLASCLPEPARQPPPPLHVVMRARFDT